MSELQFPIYCKDQGGVHAYMIISNSQVMTITNAPNEISMCITNYFIDHGVYDLYKAGELEDSNPMEFNIYRIEMNNRLTSVGVSKKAQPNKPQQS